MSSENAAAVPTTTLPIKLHIHGKHAAVDSRRFQAPADYEALRAAISHASGINERHLSVEYVDEDGDACRITNVGEWEECVRLFRAVPRAAGGALVLHARRFKKSKEPREAKDERRGRGTKAAESSGDEQEDAPAAREEAAAAQPEERGGAARAAWGEAADEAQRAALELLSSLFGCDAEAVLSDARRIVGHAMGRVVTAAAVAGQSMHVDINRVALRALAVREGNDRIERGLFAEAEALLRRALGVFRDDAVLLYNLGCAQARQLKADEALESLRRAVAAGYDDALHMARDVDLASLRTDRRYVDLLRHIARMTAGGASSGASSAAAGSGASAATVSEPAESEAKPVVAPAPPQPVALSPRSVVAQRLQEIFPHLALSAAQALAVAHNNVLEDAIESFLNGMARVARS